MPGPGRPTKLTPQVKKRILDATSAGATLNATAAYAGIHKDTLITWRRENEEFAVEFERAVGVAAVSHTLTIKRASEQGDWRAALAWLERRCPDDWSPKQVHELGGKDGGPIRHEHGLAIDPEKLSIEELDFLREIVVRQTALAEGEGE